MRDVCDALSDAGLDQYVPTVMSRVISGTYIANMRREDLIEMGMSKLGHQKRFVDKIWGKVFPSRCLI